MNAISLQEVAQNVKDLPSLPAIVMELLNDVDNEDVDISLLALHVRIDVASLNMIKRWRAEVRVR
ncbi:hypothetical protein [Undibacterium parvum]|uniref:HDOD domain-containing protein n=1 Tax=Undibacterium parvum TaxID=401471 RepID=A0A3Q9BNM3_9BURK|nr:hypothetical protein [Undibacterium parvum]AZP11046.1 hypothetical protein EJN92_02875 [Undibacterium parvum]